MFEAIRKKSLTKEIGGIITIHLNRRDFQIMGKRRTFYLTDDQFRRLGVICKKTGLSASAILRRAFDEYWERFERKGRVKAPGMIF